MNLTSEVGNSVADVYSVHMTPTTIFQSLWDAPLSARGFMSISTHDEVTFNGLQHGELSIIGLRNVAGLGTTLTIHEKGSTHWTGRGMKPSYNGASIITILISDDLWAGGTSRRYIELSRAISASTSVTERDSLNALHVGMLR